MIPGHLSDEDKDMFTMSVLRPLVMRIMMERKGNPKTAEKDLRRNDSVKKMILNFGNEYVSLRLQELMAEYDRPYTVEELLENHADCVEHALAMEASERLKSANARPASSATKANRDGGGPNSTHFSSTDMIKTHITTASLHELQPIKIKDLVVGQTHLSKRLEGVLLVDACAMVGVSTILFDGTDGISLALYNFQARGSTSEAQTQFPKGARVAVKEPYCKILGSGLRGIRIDAPSDLVLLDRPGAESSAGGPSSSQKCESKDADDVGVSGREKWKERGNGEYRKGNWDEAIRAYSRAIECAGTVEGGDESETRSVCACWELLGQSFLKKEEPLRAFGSGLCAYSMNSANSHSLSSVSRLVATAALDLEDAHLSAYFLSQCESVTNGEEDRALLEKLNQSCQNVPCPLLPLISTFLDMVSQGKFEPRLESSPFLACEAQSDFPTAVLFCNRSVARLKADRMFGALVDAFCAAVICSEVSASCPSLGSSATSNDDNPKAKTKAKGKSQPSKSEQKNTTILGHFHNPRVVKCFYRLSVALVSVGDVFAADKALKLAEKGTTPSSEMEEFRQQLNRMLKQRTVGIREDELKISQTSDWIADYIHRALVVRHSPGKGRGLFTIEPIAKGQLILACRAVALVDSREGGVVTNVINTSDMSCSLNENLVAKVVQKVSESPLLRAQLYCLCDGTSSESNPAVPHLDPSRAMAWAAPTPANRVVDGARIRRILHLNSFEWEPPEASGDPSSAPTSNESSLGARFTGLWLLPSFINHSSRKHNVRRTFQGDVLILRTTKDIAPDEEILDQYFSLLENDLETIARMKLKHNIMDPF